MLYVCGTNYFKLSYRDEVPKFSPDGLLIETRPRIYATFRHGGCPEWALKVALKRLEFNFLPDGLAPEQNISVFDSVQAQHEHGWTDEERQELEAWLAEREVYNNYIMIEPEKAAKPWEAYDKMVANRKTNIVDLAAKIVFIIEETGVDPQVVLEYERENLNRAEVIAAVEESLTPAADDDVLVGA